MVKNSLIAEMVVFTLHKPKYTPAFATALNAAIIAADAIPDETQRNADNEAKRYELMRILKASPDDLEPALGELLLGKLKNYIEGAFADKGYRKIMLKDAGFNDYDKAMRLNWETVRELFNKGKEFITEKLTELTDNDNMPAAFQTEFTNFANLVIGEVDSYLSTRENIRLITQSKIVANNAIYETIREICSDGQTLFSRNPAKRALFTWSSVLAVVTPPGAAGLRGSVKIKGSNLPVSGAIIEMQSAEGTPLSFASDADGNYYSGNLAVGLYSFKVTKTGYATIETKVEIRSGTTSYKHWKLTAGSGRVVIIEGGQGVNEIDNIVLPAGANDDTLVTMEGLAGQMQYFASDSPEGDITGTDSYFVNSGEPLELKWSVVVAHIGFGGVHSYFNVKNTGAAGARWRVTFVIA